MQGLANLRLAFTKPVQFSRSPIRCYAKAIDKSGDPRVDIMRRVLFPNNMRNKPTPTGAWRPDVMRALKHAIPSVQAHHTIDRAWLLHQRHIRHKRRADLEKKFNRMKEAMDLLFVLDKPLYAEANKEEDPRARSAEETAIGKTMIGSERKALEARIRGLFPRELRSPVDTPSLTGWNYEFKPFPRPF